MIAFKGGASDPSETLLPGKAGDAVAIRRTLASTICRITDPTLVPGPRQLRDASTVMRLRPAHQSLINRRLDDRAPCVARQSLKATLPTKPRIHSPASCKGGHESGLKLTLGTQSAGLVGVALRRSALRRPSQKPDVPPTARIGRKLRVRFRSTNEQKLTFIHKKDLPSPASTSTWFSGGLPSFWMP